MVSQKTSKTPTPWHVDFNDQDHGSTYVMDANYDPVWCGGTKDHDEAIAKLIAAAKNFLSIQNFDTHDALKAVVDEVTAPWAM